MTFFNQGYANVEKRDQEIQEALRGSLPNFILKDTDDEVYISFVTGDPITYYEHFVKAVKRSFTCSDNGDASKGTCPLCAMGNKPSFKGAYLIIDHRHEKWTDKEGKSQERQHTLKVAKFGIRVLKALQKLDAKLKKGSQVQAPVPNGILGIPFSVMRSGSGTDTQYTFTPMVPNDAMFPRKYELEAGKNEIETIVDNIKPMPTNKILEIVNRGGGAPQPQYGQPAQFGAPQPQVYGQAPQQQAAPQPAGLFGGAVAVADQPPVAAAVTQPLNLGADDDDVIDFN